MAEIREGLVLEDKFSATQSKYISGMEKAAQRTFSAQNAASGLYQKNLEMARAASKAASDYQNLITTAKSLRSSMEEVRAEQEPLLAEFDKVGIKGVSDDLIKDLEYLENKYKILARNYENTMHQAEEMKIAQAAAKATAKEEAAAVKAAEREKAAAAKVAERERVTAARQAAREKLRMEREAAAAARAAERERVAAARAAEKERVRKEKEEAAAVKAAEREKIAAEKQAAKERAAAVNAMTRPFMRMGMVLFSVGRILGYLKNAMKMAPQEIQAGWSKLLNTLSTFANSGLMGILNGLKSGMDRLNAAFNSPAGQKFAAGMWTVGQAVGKVVSLLFGAISGLVEFIGNNFQTIMTIATVVLMAFAGYMLFTAAATLLANWPLLLLIGILAALIVGLQQCGVTAADILGGIGELAGMLYATVYNLAIDIWNFFLSFAEFFANFMNDPVGSVAHLFVDFADFCLSVVESIVAGIDWLLSKIGLATGWAGAINDARSSMQNWADDTFGAKEITFDRKDHISVDDTATEWGKKFQDFGNSLSDFNLTQTAGGLNIPSSIEASPVGGSLGSDVSAIKKEVSMSEEELQAIVDMAQRQYVNQINLTAQTPIINIKGQNTGDTAEDRKALADTLRDILIEQSSAGTYRSTARVY